MPLSPPRGISAPTIVRPISPLVGPAPEVPKSPPPARRSESYEKLVTEKEELEAQVDWYEKRVDRLERRILAYETERKKTELELKRVEERARYFERFAPPLEEDFNLRDLCSLQ